MNARTEALALDDHGLRVPPHSIEAEQSVLGALLLDNGAWDRAGDLLTEGDFYRFEHRVIYQAIGALINATKPADVLTVFEQLQRAGKADEVGGLPYLNALSQSTPSAANIRRYAEIVRERALRRSLIAAADQVGGWAWQIGEDVGQQLDRAAELFTGLQRREVRKAPQPLGNFIVQALDRYNDVRDGNRVVGWSTGIPSLDRMLNRMHAGGLYILGARPGVGKTSIAQGIAQATAAEGLPTLLLSQEMLGDEIADRAIANLACIDSDRLQRAEFEGDEWNRLTEAAEQAVALPLYVDDQGSLRLSDIRIKARMVKGLKVLVLDYLQLTSSSLKDANRNTQIEEVTRGLKAMALSMGIVVIALTQLNRQVELRADKEPQLADLRDSGAIEQDADAVVLLWTVRELDGGARRIVGCKVAKNRGGRIGRFALEFVTATHRWYESTASLEGQTLTEQRGRRPEL